MDEAFALAGSGTIGGERRALRASTPHIGYLDWLLGFGLIFRAGRRTVDTRTGEAR